VLCWRFS